MSQQSIESIFGAKPISLIDLFEDRADLGFRIPEYQRAYNWGEENIHRLFEDVLLGLSYRLNDQNALTFLGTIILLEDRKKEEKFNGNSYKVIDGQQRLTTFSLLSCVLHEALENLDIQINELELKKQVKTWLILESEALRTQLYGLFCGELSGKARMKFPFPRIVRAEQDYRAKTIQDYEYRSTIATTLNNFRTYVDKKDPVLKGGDYDFSAQFKENKGDSFNNALKVIQDGINTILGHHSKKTDSLVVNFPKLTNIDRTGFRSLFDCLPNDDREANKLLSALNNKIQNVEPIVRLILFTSFLLNKVIVTRIIVTDQKYGFDIFDSLNTTGEPLTAIQTFKPKVVRFEMEKNREFKGSPCEEYFNTLEEYLNQFDGNNNDKRQRAAKDLVVSFALYKTGEKLSLSLTPQRRYLHNRFEKISSLSVDELKGKRRFVKDLVNITDYKTRFWTPQNIGKQLNSYPEKERSQVLLGLKFLKDSNSSLTIPILCRFYHEALATGNNDLFSKAVKALTAFVLLRRSVTINTAGIDSDFRGLMSKGSLNGNKGDLKICIGLGSDNKIPSIVLLKEYLRSWLGQKKIGVIDKESWLKSVVIQPIYQTSVHVSRFLHLAAAHNSRIDEKDLWKLTKSSVRKSPETNYLSYVRWNSEEVSTVEHIAPKTVPKGGWDKDIYYPDTKLRHSLGNLTLLPFKENALVGTKKWVDKKLFFRAFSSKTETELDSILEEAKKAGINLSKVGRDTLFEKGVHRPLANSIANVKSWDAKHIKKRSLNIAELAWEEISPWLF